MDIKITVAKEGNPSIKIVRMVTKTITIPKSRKSIMNTWNLGRRFKRLKIAFFKGYHQQTLIKQVKSKERLLRMAMSVPQ